jgi:hypothetical protein
MDARIEEFLNVIVNLSRYSMTWTGLDIFICWLFKAEK